MAKIIRRLAFDRQIRIFRHYSACFFVTSIKIPAFCQGLS
jgi:hypothetical protein